ncbi:MAG: hypothetical protein N0E59_01965 [Candidatus Thiodiazotropha taylori]|nr:hypothetical protein [Candidatus Thiodiazotropha taylori]MCG8092619.1 hypothetical protein [Candidatus Thiodiazotropha endolucinida]MCG8109507.1 hypothetical protein [Candidatus Thiodiazotropha taylori]MCW4281848.1 hypothetical protein [Candidatus Thiodiazotropha taylori]MCW4305958.1 hypothetical protein [Candidatus Thiodiazotropha taylori]
MSYRFKVFSVLFIFVFPQHVFGEVEIHEYKNWYVVEGSFLRSIAGTKSEINDVQLAILFYHFACDQPSMNLYFSNPHGLKMEVTKKETVYRLRVDKNEIYDVNWGIFTDSLANNMIGHIINGKKQSDGSLTVVSSLNLIPEMKKGLKIRTKLDDEINRFNLSGFTKAYNQAEKLCHAEKAKLDALSDESNNENPDEGGKEESFYDSKGNLIKGK